MCVCVTHIPATKSSCALSHHVHERAQPPPHCDALLLLLLLLLSPQHHEMAEIVPGRCFFIIQCVFLCVCERAHTSIRVSVGVCDRCVEQKHTSDLDTHTHPCVMQCNDTV